MAYTYYRTITIDHTKCGSTNSTDFPILISGTYSYLAVVGSGGEIQNTTTQTGGGASITVPADLKFTSDIGGTTLLKWEFETYNSTTGAVNIWVKIPTLSASVDTLIYMFTNDSTTTTWQGDVPNTWNSDYKSVYHLPDGTTLGAKDSTSNALNGTISGATAATGKVDGGASFNGTNNDHITITPDSSWNNQDFTVSFWAKMAVSQPGSLETIWDYGHNVSKNWVVQSGAADTTGSYYCAYYSPSGFQFMYSTVPPDNTWYYITYIKNGTNCKGYQNGAELNNYTLDGTVTYNTVYSAQLSGYTAGAGREFTGTLDECRLSGVARNADWILSEYNSMLASFYTVGSQTPTASGIAYDAATNSTYQAAASSYSWSHTCTGTNRFLSVDIEMLSLAQTVTGITYNSVAMTLIGVKNSVSGAARVECWGLIAPSTGSNTIAVTLSGSIASAGTAVSYTGVQQTSPTEAFNSAQATNVGATDASVVITSVADNCWIHAACASDDTAITAGQTSRNNVTGAGGSGADEDNNAAKTPAGAVTMTYTNIAALATWVIAGYAIRPVAAGALGTSNFFLGM